MKPLSFRPGVAAPTGPTSAAASSGAEFRARLGALYALAQDHDHLFASPLGSLAHAGESAWLPRFVFFGPRASRESWRVAILTGFDHRSLRPAAAALNFIREMAERPAGAHGLHLSFFPLLDVAGHALKAPARRLNQANWACPSAPEIALLEKDARQWGYHGFIRIESAPADEEVITVRVRGPGYLPPAPDAELISSHETDPFPVRFERPPLGALVREGPLAAAEDFPVQPFELTLEIPAGWPADRQDEAVSSILWRFLLRYRAFQAYGQNL